MSIATLTPVLRRCSALWLFAAALLAWQLAVAQPAVALYQDEVPVADRTEDARTPAFRQALGMVIERLAGQLPADRQSALQPMLDKASYYVQEYEYRGGEEDKSPLRMWVRFDGQAVERDLRGTGTSYWGSARPTVLAWIALQDNGDRYWLEGDSPPVPSAAFKTAAANYGLPVIFPLFDLEDLAEVKLADLMGGFDQGVRNSIRRYQAQGTLAVSAFKDTGAWNLRWRYYQRADDTGRNWTTSAPELTDAFAQGLEKLTNQLRESGQSAPALTATAPAQSGSAAAAGPVPAPATSVPAPATAAPQAGATLPSSAQSPPTPPGGAPAPSVPNPAAQDQPAWAPLPTEETPATPQDNSSTQQPAWAPIPESESQTPPPDVGPTSSQPVWTPYQKPSPPAVQPMPSAPVPPPAHPYPVPPSVDASRPAAAASPAPAAEGGFLLIVSGVDSLEDYAKLDRYLAGVSQLEAHRPYGLGGGKAVFRIESKAGTEAVARQMELDGVLRKPDSADVNKDAVSSTAGTVYLHFVHP